MTADVIGGAFDEVDSRHLPPLTAVAVPATAPVKLHHKDSIWHVGQRKIRSYMRAGRTASKGGADSAGHVDTKTRIRARVHFDIWSMRA